MINKFSRQIIAFILGVCAVFSTFTFPADAATISWDGSGEIVAGKSYALYGVVNVKKSLVIPKGAKLSIKKDAQLNVYKNASIDIQGTVNIAIGGKLKVSGRIDVGNDAVLNVYGECSTTVSSQMKCKGKLNVYNRGTYKTSGNSSFYKVSTIHNNGYMIFLISSETKSGAVFTTTARSETHIRGSFIQTLSGDMTVRGLLKIGGNSYVKNSGAITLVSRSEYDTSKDIILTKSAIFLDLRDSYKYERMMAAILKDEPEVELRGIDVSTWQGEIDWEKVGKSGIDFVMIRAARGAVGNKVMNIDDRFKRNIEGAIANGVDAGVYFYSYATTVEQIKKEAEFFVETIKGYEITYPVVLDMEESSINKLSRDTATEMVEAFFEIVMDAGYFPMITSYKNFFDANLDARILDKYAVWIAQINNKVTYQGDYYIWQYSWTGRVDGINGDVDLDISYRDFASILRKNKLNNLK